MIIKDTGSILSIGGSLSGCLLCFSFPSFCRLFIDQEKIFTFKGILHIIMILFGLISSIICFYFALYFSFQSVTI